MEFDLKIGDVDISNLVTDDDFRREAERILPGALQEIARVAGEEAWKNVIDSMHQMGFTGEGSPSEKQACMDSTSEQIIGDGSPQTHADIIETIISKLKELKAAG